MTIAFYKSFHLKHVYYTLVVSDPAAAASANMLRNGHWLLLLVVVVTCCFHETKATCSLPDFRACVAKVPFDQTIPTENLTQADFQYGCRNLAAFSACVSALHCTSGDKLYPTYLKYLDTVEGYDYLCQSDTQTAFFANTECLRAGFNSHQLECAQSVEAPSGDNDRCRYIYDRAECAFNQTMVKCNDVRIARLIKMVIINTHKRQYKAEYDCVIGEAEETCSTANFQICRNNIPFNLTISTQDLTRMDFRRGCGTIAAFSDCVVAMGCTSGNARLYPYYLKYLDAAEKYTYLCRPDTQTAFFANVGCLRTGFGYHENECAESVREMSGPSDGCRYLYDRAECAFNWTLASCKDERVARLIRNVIVKEYQKQYELMTGCVVERTLVTASTEGPCLESKLERCLAALESNPNLRYNIEAYNSDEKIDTACSALNAWRGCVVNSQCEGKHEKSDQFLATMDFLCRNESRQVFKEANRCFASESTRSNVTKQCSFTANRNQSVDRCREYKEAQACTKVVHTAHCGKNATDLMYEVREKFSSNNPCIVAKTGKSSWFTFTISDAVMTSPRWSIVIALSVFLSTLLLNSGRLSTGAL